MSRNNLIEMLKSGLLEMGAHTRDQIKKEMFTLKYTNQNGY